MEQVLDFVVCSLVLGGGSGLSVSVEPDCVDAGEFGGADVVERCVPYADGFMGFGVGSLQGGAVVFWLGFEAADNGFTEYIIKIINSCGMF